MMALNQIPEVRRQKDSRTLTDLWHRRDHPPRPVIVVAALGEKVRVLDLVESTVHHLIFRDVYPRNLTRRWGWPDNR